MVDRPSPLPPVPSVRPDKERLPRIGDLVGGKYRVTRFLGMGGMGKVMAADHVGLRQTVAIKFLHPHLVTSKTALRRFAREARASAALRSPHAVRILDVDQLPDGSHAPYLVMEHLEGHSLERFIFDNRLPPAEAATRWIIQACDALGEAHARGIVHRDVKPENLFLATVPGVPGLPIIKVLDLGLAKWQEDAKESTAETATNAAVGSPQYMSPEQILGTPVDARADLWALGATLYELLTGKPPFVAKTVHELFRRILHAPIRHLAELRPDLPAALTAAVMRCLERDPARRWPSAGDFAAALELAFPRPERSSSPALVRDVTLSIPPPPPTVRIRPRTSQLRNIAVGTLGFFTVLVAASSTFALGQRALRAHHPAAHAAAPESSAIPVATAATKAPADFGR